MKVTLILFVLFKISLTNLIHIHYHFSNGNSQKGIVGVHHVGRWCEKNCLRYIGNKREQQLKAGSCILQCKAADREYAKK